MQDVEDSAKGPFLNCPRNIPRNNLAKIWWFTKLILSQQYIQYFSFGRVLSHYYYSYKLQNINKAVILYVCLKIIYCEYEASKNSSNKSTNSQNKFTLLLCNKSFIFQGFIKKDFCCFFFVSLFILHWKTVLVLWCCIYILFWLFLLFFTLLFTQYSN